MNSGGAGRGRNADSLADIAREASVSLATASRALNNAYGVSESTRQRVLEVARKRDYVVSNAARSLARGTTNRVAVIVPHIERWFFGEIVNGIQRVLADAGVDLLLYQVDGPDARRTFFEQLPARRKVDAVIAVAFPVDEVEQARLESMAVTIIAAGGQAAAYPHAGIDDYAAARAAVDHLVGLGHRRIGMIAGSDPFRPSWPAESVRTRAFVDVMAEAGLPTSDDLIRTVEWQVAAATAAMDDILTRNNPPSAVFAHSDELAIGAIRAIVRRGLRVPDDISVIGFDDHPLAESLDLTTIYQPVREQGEAAARFALAALRRDGEDPVESSLLPTRLVVRGSTKPASTALTDASAATD